MNCGWCVSRHLVSRWWCFDVELELEFTKIQYYNWMPAYEVRQQNKYIALSFYFDSQKNTIKVSLFLTFLSEQVSAVRRRFPLPFSNFTLTPNVHYKNYTENNMKPKLFECCQGNHYTPFKCTEPGMF